MSFMEGPIKLASFSKKAFISSSVSARMLSAKVEHNTAFPFPLLQPLQNQLDHEPGNKAQPSSAGHSQQVEAMRQQRQQRQAHAWSCPMHHVHVTGWSVSEPKCCMHLNCGRQVWKGSKGTAQRFD
jgi:hypothetical protein